MKHIIFVEIEVEATDALEAEGIVDDILLCDMRVESYDVTNVFASEGDEDDD